jgi:hypothetical protein
MEPICVTDPGYGFYDQEMQSFVMFLPKLSFSLKPEDNSFGFSDEI